MDSGFPINFGIISQESNIDFVEIYLFDMMGKQWISKKIKHTEKKLNLELLVNDIPSGIYVVSISINGSLSTQHKILIQN